MSSRDEQGLTTSRTRPKTQPPTDGLLQLHPTFERFLRAVDDEVETRITEDEIERRLSRIKEARPPREAPPSGSRPRSWPPASSGPRTATTSYGSGWPALRPQQADRRRHLGSRWTTSTRLPSRPWPAR